MIEFTKKDVTIVVRRNDNPEPIVTGVPGHQVIAHVLEVLSDTEAMIPRLLMVRTGNQVSKTILAVANQSWLNRHGEFCFNNPADDEVIWDRVQHSPRSWALVTLTQQLIRSQSVEDASRAYHALTVLGIGFTEHIYRAKEILFTHCDGEPITDRTTYRDAYERALRYHAERGHYLS